MVGQGLLRERLRSPTKLQAGGRSTHEDDGDFGCHFCRVESNDFCYWFDVCGKCTWEMKRVKMGKDVGKKDNDGQCDEIRE